MPSSSQRTDAVKRSFVDIHRHAAGDLHHRRLGEPIGLYIEAGNSAEQFTERLVSNAESLVVGDPSDERTDVGPLIDKGALDRVDAWVREALDGGAKALCGAERDDPCYLPTVLTDVRSDMKVVCREVFGPVVVVQPYASFDEALAMANDSPYGLQAGVFTNDVSKVFRAHRELRVGGVIHNDVTAFRADQMPYGGVKASGQGREGLRYAMEEMSETRILVLSDLDL